MILWLLYPLHGRLPLFNVFRYITFRAANAALMALLLSIFLGPALIRWLRAKQIGQSIREEGPKGHQVKAGTPTMGGVLINLAIVVPTLFFADLSNRYVWVALVATVLAMLIGVGDDWRKVSRKNNRGLSGRQKLVLQTAIGLGVAWASMRLFEARPGATQIALPFLKNVHPDLGLFYILLATVVVVGSSNAVNLTDGLDGLAIGATLIASATFAILAYIAGQREGRGLPPRAVRAGHGRARGLLRGHRGRLARLPLVQLASGRGLHGRHGLARARRPRSERSPSSSSRRSCSSSWAGSSSSRPLSVILQVGFFKLRGKRIFRMAPLHHHFELAGWPESKVIIRFWIVAILFALFALSTLKLR